MAGGSQNIAWIKQHLGARIESLPVQGDQPLLLDDPSCAYLTLAPHQLFCVGYRDGRAEGRREHLSACAPGQLIFGMEPTAPRGATVTALLLAGVSGSVVWRVPMAALLAIGEQDEGRRTLAELFDGWISLLIAALPPSQVPTRSRLLEAGQNVQLKRETPVCGGAGIVWIAPAAAPRVYRGIDIGAHGTRADAWPLASGTWLLGEPGEFRVWNTEQLLRASGRAAFAEGFTRFVASVVAVRRARVARTRLQRDQEAMQHEAQHTSAALHQLARVGSSQAQFEPGEPASGGGAFEQACERILTLLRIEPLPQIERPRGGNLAQMQLALGGIHGVRTRPVMLESEWWRGGDGGPLLGFMPDASEPERVHPVALVPDGRAGYTRYDPRDGSTVAIGSKQAAELHPRAHQFYRSFPPTRLSPLDVLRFAAQDVRGDALRIVLIGLGGGLLGTALPLLTGQVFDRIIPGAERGLLFQLVCVLIAVFAASWLFDLARGFALIRAHTRVDTRLEAGTWDRLLSLPLPFFRSYSAGDLANRAQGIGAMRDVLAQVGLSTLLSGIFSIWNFALLFYYSVSLALAATVLVAIAGIVAVAATYYELQAQRALSELDGKIGGLSLQLLGGVAKLRGSGGENRAFGVWARLFARRRDLDLSGARIMLRIGVFESVYPLLCSMVLYFLIARNPDTKLSTGQFLAFSAAFAMFMRAMLSVLGAGLQSLKIWPLYERARPILQSELESRGAGDVRVQLQGALELNHVSFRYEPKAPLVLDDLTLRIEPGEFVAIVGASGSGKSTLLRIMLGFDLPSEGGVFYDGQALAGMDVRKVRQQIGVVLQHSSVMAGDIYTNIVGSSGRSIDEAWRAARLAAFDKDIEAMPMGMHTVLAQGGGTLSGGQRQRLLISRALAAEPRLLFFDEATSALDNQTQAAVSESLDQLRITRVVIAHRLSTIRHADRIVVLERGRIVQEGSFDQLLAQDGVFASLARRQLL